MDLLRWILLGIGLLLILAIWWHGRRHRPARQESLLATARRRWRRNADTASATRSASVDLPAREAPDLGLDTAELDELFGEQREGIESRFHTAAEKTSTGHERKPLADDEPEAGTGESGRPAPASHDDDLESIQGSDADRDSAEETAEAGQPAVDDPLRRSPPEAAGNRQASDPDPPPADKDRPADEDRPADVDRIVALYVVAPRGERLHGGDLLSAFSRLGLEHGDLDIFHRHDDQQRTVFSVANAAEPGTFDPTTMRELETPGVALFMRLPTPIPAPDAFDELVTAARALAADVGGHALDSRQSTLTRQTEQAMSDDMRDYELHRKRAAR